MIRVALFLVLIVVLALAAVWLADRPGDVAITWQGLRIETSVMVAAVVIAAVIAFAIALWSLLRGLMRAPARASAALAERRRRRGFTAISRGLVAIGAGAAVGRRGGARVPLRRGRLGGRARVPRGKPGERPPRQGGAPAPARRAAHRPRHGCAGA